MALIKRMVHVTLLYMNNQKGYRAFRNPFLRAIARSFPEAKYIWLDENIHLNFIDGEDNKHTIRIPTPLHIIAWLKTYQIQPMKCSPISFGISFELSKEQHEQFSLSMDRTNKSTG